MSNVSQSGRRGQPRVTVRPPRTTKTSQSDSWFPSAASDSHSDSISIFTQICFSKKQHRTTLPTIREQPLYHPLSFSTNGKICFRFSDVHLLNHYFIHYDSHF